MMLRVLDFNHHQSTGPIGQRVATTDFATVKAAGCAAVINRTAYGTRIDELAAEHNRRADAVGLPRLFYGYHLSRQDPHTQAELAFHHSGGQRGRRGARDLEESVENDGRLPAFPRYSWDHWRHVNAGLVRTDELTGLLTMVYSRATWLDFWFTAEQQARWSDRLGWWAHYNTAINQPDAPLGWKDKPLAWALWQDRVAPWPGVARVVDQNWLNPALTLAALLGSAPPVGDTPAGTVAGHAAAILGLVG